MTETGKCRFLKPLPSDHPKPSELTYMFICSFDSPASEEYLGGWNSVLSRVPRACWAASGVLFLSSDSWPSIWKYSPPCFTELRWCLPKIITTWAVFRSHTIKLISLLPTNLIFKGEFTFFYIQEFNFSISLCKMITKDNNSPVWTGRTFLYLFQHDTGEPLDVSSSALLCPVLGSKTPCLILIYSSTGLSVWAQLSLPWSCLFTAEFRMVLEGRTV